jgi:DNA-binding PadR family transcriptional regulator
MLATLLDGPKHGYELKKHAGMIFGHGTLHNNLVYPLLRRFTTQGWVTRKTVPGLRGQRRQQYALTAAGRRELLHRLTEFSEEDAYSSGGFRLRVSLFALLPEKAQAQILAARETALTAQASRLDQIQHTMTLDEHPAQVINFMRAQITRELQWIEQLRDLKPTQP